MIGYPLNGSAACEHCGRRASWSNHYEDNEGLRHPDKYKIFVCYECGRHQMLADAHAWGVARQAAESALRDGFDPKIVDELREALFLNEQEARRICIEELSEYVSVDPYVLLKAPESFPTLNAPLKSEPKNRPAKKIYRRGPMGELIPIVGAALAKARSEDFIREMEGLFE